MSKLLLSWNVNGVRAAVQKGFLEFLRDVEPDVLGIQETKAHTEQLGDDVLHPEGYTGIWNQAKKKGYSGVATFVKDKPAFSTSQFGEDLLDEEGRIVLTEHDGFYLFNVYFPNGGRGEERLKYKLDFYKRFLELANAYRKKHPVIICGDINTAHREIDLARPKQNEKTSGFMPVERAWLDELEANGYVDSFRAFHPGEAEWYTWWDMKSRSRDRNVGWRIDYFWVDKALMPRVTDAFILRDIHGSDHCPVGIRID